MGCRVSEAHHRPEDDAHGMVAYAGVLVGLDTEREYSGNGTASTG